MGGWNLEVLKDLPDEVVRSTFTALRGWGPWSANYFLVAGWRDRTASLLMTWPSVP